MQRSFLLAALISLAFIYSCSPKYQANANNYTLPNQLQPDYSNINSWATHPYKYDPSDSVPLPLKQSYHYDSSVDVFFLHPTTYTQKGAQSWSADFRDQGLNEKTDYSTILYQASAFNEYRLFAPRYRQAHLRSYFSADTAAALAAFELAYQDIRNAFKFYLEHYNNGRPLVIASHSQGTTHALRLLREFFDQSALREKLVVAYLVGMYIPENYFSNLTICKDPSQINCFCGWRTYRVNYIPPFVQKETIKSCVTNPLNWRDSTDLATAELNKGAILRKFNRVYYNVSDAKINEGIVWTKKPKFPGSFLLRTKNYHIGDINLYYYSVRENTHQRVTAYKKN